MDSENKPKGSRYTFPEEYMFTDATVFWIEELKEENARLRRELAEARNVIEKLKENHGTKGIHKSGDI